MGKNSHKIKSFWFGEPPLLDIVTPSLTLLSVKMVVVLEEEVDEEEVEEVDDEVEDKDMWKSFIS